MRGSNSGKPRVFGASRLALAISSGSLDRSISLACLPRPGWAVAFSPGFRRCFDFGMAWTFLRASMLLPVLSTRRVATWLKNLLAGKASRASNGTWRCQNNAAREQAAKRTLGATRARVAAWSNDRHGVAD